MSHLVQRSWLEKLHSGFGRQNFAPHFWAPNHFATSEQDHITWAVGAWITSPISQLPMSVPRPSEKPVRSETGIREEPADLISSTKWHHQSPLVTRIPLKGQLYQLTVKNNFNIGKLLKLLQLPRGCGPAHFDQGPHTVSVMSVVARAVTCMWNTMKVPAELEDIKQSGHKGKKKKNILFGFCPEPPHFLWRLL